jgi:tRNA A22 N-methylase
MTIVYKVKRSETSSSTPGSGDLAVGELALNLTDAKIFSKKSDGTIVSFNTTTETPVFFADEVDLGNLTTATNTYDMSSLDGGSPASGGGIALTDLSVTTNSAGTAALSYNNSTGVFTYTPPDLSSYLTSYTVTESDVTTHQAALSITESQISDLGTYLTSYTVTESDVTTHQAACITESQISDLGTYLTSYTVTESDVTTHQAALSITESQISDLQTYLTSETFTSLVQDTTPQLGGDLDLNTNNITGTGNIDIDGILTQGTDSYHTHQYVLHGTTTNATETEILTTASTRIPVATDTTLFYEVSIVSRRTDATGESGSWHLKGCADNFSGTVADVGSLYEIAVAQDDTNLSVDVRADDTNNAINVFVTGAASKTIRWTAIVKTTEVAQ